MPKSQEGTVVQKILNREMWGSFSRKYKPSNKAKYLYDSIPRSMQFHLKTILPNIENHILMGPTQCGKYLITYTFENISEETFSNYEYFLHFWLYVPGKAAMPVGQVKLFKNYPILELLTIGIAQWPSVPDKILVYGYGSSAPLPVEEPEDSKLMYLTITMLPAKCEKCQTLKQSLHINPEVRCMKHGLTVDVQFNLAPPHPSLNVEISMRRENMFVVNCGNCLHAVTTRMCSWPEPSPMSKKNQSTGKIVIVNDTKSRLADDLICSPNSRYKRPLTFRTKSDSQYIAVCGVQAASSEGLLIPELMVPIPSPVTGSERNNQVYEFKKEEDFNLQYKWYRKRTKADKMYEFEVSAEDESATPSDIDYSSEDTTPSSSPFKKYREEDFNGSSQKLLAKDNLQVERETFALRNGQINWSPSKCDKSSASSSSSSESICHQSGSQTSPLRRSPRNRKEGDAYVRKFFVSDPKHGSANSSNETSLSSPQKENIRAATSKQDEYYNKMNKRRKLLATYSRHGVPVQITKCTSGFTHVYSEVDCPANSSDSSSQHEDADYFQYKLTVNVRNSSGREYGFVGDDEVADNCCVVKQDTFDMDIFCPKAAQLISLWENYTYLFCNDYGVEIVGVCPLNGDVTALASMTISCIPMIHTEISRKRKFVGKHSEIECETRCLFIWNPQSNKCWMEAYLPLIPVPVQRSKVVCRFSPYPNLTKEAADLSQRQLGMMNVPILRPIRHFVHNIDEDSFFGPSLKMMTDEYNMIALYLDEGTVSLDDQEAAQNVLLLR